MLTIAMRRNQHQGGCSSRQGKEKRRAFKQARYPKVDEQRSKPVTTEPEISVFRPDRPGIRKVLGDLEAEIMELLWEHPIKEGTTVREVFEVLYERRRMAYTTIMNTMTRMAKKRFLRVEKQDAAYVYYPILTQQEFIDGFVNRILENLFVNFSGSTRAGIEALPDQEAATHARARLDEIIHRRTSEEG